MYNLRSYVAVFLSIILVHFSLIDQQIMAHSNLYPIRKNNLSNSEFIYYTSTLRSEIKQHYQSLIESIKQREEQLLQELDSIEQEYRNQYQKHNTTLDKLENSKQYIIHNVCTPESPQLKEYCEKILKVTNEKIEAIELKIIEKTNVTFEWDEILANKISQIGKLHRDSEISNNSYNYPGKPNCLANNYRSKLSPIIEAGIRGKSIEQLYKPFGVTTDKNTSNIYIVGENGNRVSVFNSTGKFQFKFKGIMKTPIGIAIYEDKVYVSQYTSHSIRVYNLDGTFLNQFGSFGTGNGQLNHPYGLDVSPINGDIYVSDKGNRRVQIFDKYFNHKSYIVDQLKGPVDVKLTQHEIFVLDNPTKSVKVYDYNNNYLRSVINSTGDGYHLKSPYCMFIDGNNNILLTDYTDGNVLIFNHLGDIIDQIGTNTDMFSSPLGITVDQSCRLIVVNQKQNAVIQIF